MKQHTAPVIIQNKNIQTLEKLSLDSKEYNEEWVQSICYQKPEILPVEELEPTFGGLIPICKELTVESGSVDLIYVNEFGFITIGECKLWRNPEARRKVVGQVLDYAKDLSKWDYTKFEKECLRQRKGQETKLYDVVNHFYPDVIESEFVDHVQRNLRLGRFLLLIIGDGIRENMEELADYLHRNGNLNFTLGLIELPLFRNPMSNDIIITPRILAKTTEIERIIYRVSDNVYEESNQSSREKQEGETISMKVFLERLTKAIGKENTDKFTAFTSDLQTELNIATKLGRGKQLSLNLKSPDDTYNFASIQDNGEVWFYGIVIKTSELGSKQIGIDYLKTLATIVGGEFDDSRTEWSWSVKKNSKYLSISEYLSHTKEWADLIASTMDRIYRVDEN